MASARRPLEPRRVWDVNGFRVICAARPISVGGGVCQQTAVAAAQDANGVGHLANPLGRAAP